MLIGITGQKFAGKSTVANMLSEILGYETCSFADKLKDVTCVLSGCTREQLEDYNFKENELVPDYLQPYCLDAEKPTYRAFLQHFGSEVMRGVNDNIWIDCTLSKCGENAIISDVRFPNEAKAIRERGGIIVKVVRDNATTSDTHQSETHIDEIEPTYILPNNGSLEALRELIKPIVSFCQFLKLYYMEFYIKEGFKLNPNEKIVNAILKGIERCGGECPCNNTSEDKMCPCSNYKLHNHCCCNLYVKDE